jgi:DNA-binding transcriptional regulator YhcF (GntR family)
MAMTAFDDRSPIYRQIAERISEDILVGSLAEEDQVMSTNQYAAFYRINPATAAKAFQHLVDEEILYKKRGIGMFVSPGARKKLQDQHRALFFTGVVSHLVNEARSIGISLEDVIAHLQDIADKENT